MVGRLTEVPHIVEDFVVGLDIGTGLEFLANNITERRRCHQLSCLSDGADIGFPVVRAIQEVVVDRGLLLRMGRFDVKAAGAFGALRVGEHA